jgi:two-component system nitrogen regulation response regulator NtrX
MAYRILILDDDTDFNSLLTDIFEQADYAVTSLLDPHEAVEAFSNQEFDLVVTDHKMPEMTGAEFSKLIKKMKPQVPVILVSGYLDNDTIRELISNGIGGVFLKPLNIFALLQRTAELIEDAQNSDQTDSTEADSGVDLSEESAERVIFAFRSFPCKSEASIHFAERLYNLRNFTSTLSLIGGPGTHFRQICEDFAGFYQGGEEHFIYLRPCSFDAEQVLSLLTRCQAAGAGRITCVLLEVEAMSAAQKELAAELPNADCLFESITTPVRTIFCVSGDLDSLYDEGQIDEDLYVLMGTAEVCVPALSDCAADIAVMAQQMVVDLIREKGLSSVPRFESAAQDFLSSHSWDNNYAQLRAMVRALMDTSPSELITLADLDAALKASAAASPRAQFEAHLTDIQLDYVQAVSILFGGDRVKVADFFGADLATTEALLK